MRALVLINMQAGTLIGLDPSTIVEDISRAFRQRGHDVVVSGVRADEIEQRLKDGASDPSFDTLIVGGGDGTVRLGAKYAIECDKVLGVLPLGTLNLLAKDLNIPLNLEDATRAISMGVMQRIDAARVNGRIYLCNSLIGLPPKFSARRQSLRGRPLWKRIQGYFSILRQILTSARRFSITLDHGGDVRMMRVLSLAIANNAYEDESRFGFARPRLDQGHLAVYASRHATGWALAGSLVRAIFGTWKGDPLIWQLKTTGFTLRTRSSTLTISNDGEVERLETPLHYGILPRALKILVPA